MTLSHRMSLLFLFHQMTCIEQAALKPSDEYDQIKKRNE